MHTISRSLLFFLLFALAFFGPVSTHVVRAAVLFDSDLGAKGTAINIKADSGATAVGEIPSPWQEQSTWQGGVRLRYERVVVAGRSALRITNSGSGIAQLHYPVAGLRGGAYYHLKAVARNPRQLDIKFGIRDNGDPWRGHWNQGNGFGDEWQTFETDFQLPRLDREVGFYLFVTGVGSVDIAQIRLEERTEEEIVAEKLKRYSKGAPRNLMSRTRFPLGLSSGWALEAPMSNYAIRDFAPVDGAVINADPKTIGPSGSPALHVRIPQSSRRPWLWAPPFEVINLKDKHVASVWVKGRARGVMQVKRDYWPTIGEKSIEFNDDNWHRVEIPFEPGILGMVWSVRFEADGEFWVDGFQVERGEKATAYASTTRSEVDLNMASGEAAIARIHFADEAPTFRWAVTNGRSGDRLRLQMKTYDNRVLKLPAVALRNGYQTGTATYGKRPNIPLGPLRIEARVEDAQGKPQSAWVELIVTRIPRPRFWGQFALHSPFGTHIEGTRQTATFAKAIGINWIRMHDSGGEPTKWMLLEPEKGQWKWNDTPVQRYREAKLEIMGGLQTTPAWASTDPKGSMRGTYFDQFFLPKNDEDWRNYVRQVATRYPFINTWDIWNEPWGFGYSNLTWDESKNGRGGYVQPPNVTEAYGRLVRLAREELHKLDAKKRVVWDADVRENPVPGIKTPAEVFAFHLYGSNLNGFEGDAASVGVAERRESLEKTYGEAGHKTPLWMTEGSGVNDRQFAGYYTHTVPASYTLESPAESIENASRSSRFVMSLLFNGCGKVFPYTASETGYFTKKKFAVYTMEDGYPHPAAASHAAMAYFLENTQPVGKVEVANGVWAYGWQSNDQKRSVAVISSRADAGKYLPPLHAKLTRHDLFGNQITDRRAFDGKMEFLEWKGDWASLKRVLAKK